MRKGKEPSFLFSGNILRFLRKVEHSEACLVMNISFINPLFLWGLPLVSIPILIHLLTKKKAKRLAFSEVKFIQLASSKVIKRYRLTEFLLLLIRMLILLILILFFARPVFYALPLLGSGSKVSANIVFILDNSYSMGYQQGEQSRFVIAKQIIKQLINKLDKRDRAALILMNSKAESPVGYFTFDKKILLSEIEKSNLSFYPTDISKALDKAYTVLSDSISSSNSFNPGGKYKVSSGTPKAIPVECSLLG